MSGLIYLITGASRGIGRAYVTALLQRSNSNSTIIAAVRNPEDNNSKSLKEVEAAKGNKLIVVKIDTVVDDDPKKAVEDLKTSYGIDRLDVVVHNAGSVLEWGPLVTLSPAGMRAMYDVNAVSILALYQATKPLLEKSTLPNGKFIYIGSSAGAMADVATFGGHPPAAYFASKAAGHFLLRCIAQQDDKLVISCFCPGLVSTGLGNEAVLKEGKMTIEEKTAFYENMGSVKAEDSARGLLQNIELVDREHSHDKFYSNMGSLKEGKLVETAW